ncbi:MAG: hypothetical protein H6723_02730 [Sandaracinus sp.]|nr:hypothetical protein [Sandaracinus sp.]
MTRTLLALALLSVPLVARAQGPDVRDVRPIVMLLVDSSGSMERRGDCVCTTPTCNECMPTCSGATPQRNRWATVLEALTGTWDGFTCAAEDRRNSGYASQADFRYYIDHILHPGEARRIGGGTFAPTVTQQTDGILDSYADRAKFGLMTFDGVSTLRDRPLLVTQLDFEMPGFLTSSAGALGGFSYGERKPFGFPGCGQAYMIDNGAQSEQAGGTLVSVGSDAEDFTLINTNIQAQLLATRPYGPTPIAGMLEDFEFYLQNHPDVAARTVAGGSGDAFQACRPRYAILLTDGYPNADMRDAPYNCEGAGHGFGCPYDTPATTAARLCEYSGASEECEGYIDGLFVVGFTVEDARAVQELHNIAAAGGTCANPATGECAYLVGSSSGPAQLREALADILDQANPGTTTRTVNAFSGTSPGASAQGQAQFNTGFQIPGEGEPWAGVLERRRFECDASNVPMPQDVEDRDRFQTILNNRPTPRRLLTALPNNRNNVRGYLIGDGAVPASVGGSGSASGGGNGRGGSGGRQCGGGGRTTPADARPAETGVRLTSFAQSNAALDRRLFGTGVTQTERNNIIDWVHGVGRANRLGDIYHSSPVVVGAPEEDLADESYNEFRRRPEVANRPKVVYVGTNDGIMHAFVAEDITITTGPHAGERYTAGEELWGFVPPAVIPSLNSARTGHVFTVDGTPVVKDIFYNRAPGQSADASAYHTVMVFGLRGGGGAYLALDVTDPLEPEFLWQVAHPEMGATYGIPALGQVLIRDSSNNVREISMVLLPGGAGTDLSSGTCGGVAEPLPDGRMSKPLGCPSRGKGRPPVNAGTLNARENMRCWDTTGRSMYFVDPASGEILSYLDDTVFNAPVTGGVSFFTGDVGTIATRAFVTDADGVIWRVDFSNPDPARWDAEPFHDIFHDLTATEGQPAYFPPILTTDDQGRVVVIQATGEVDNLDQPYYENRVVSITENPEYDTTGALRQVTGILNWEVRLEQGERVTGPLELFAGKVYFASFATSPTTSIDACSYGYSRIWGVEYLLNETSATQPTNIPLGALEDTDAPGTFVRHLPPLENQIVMGVRVTQRPTCSTLQEVSETDPYFGTRTYQQVTNANRGEFFLVAQVSGGGTAATGASVAEFSRQLPAPLSYTRVQGWAGSID